ncbi:MAG TPA: LapA family protein [bacterium]|nr:LapA family protein [bacterium]
MLLLGFILLIVVVVFALENRAPVTVEFLAWRYDTLVGVAMIAAGVAGAIIIYLSGVVAAARLRSRLRSAEARVKELEQQLKVAASQIPQITYGERE